MAESRQVVAHQIDGAWGAELGAQAPVGESDDVGHRADQGHDPRVAEEGRGRSTNTIESMISVRREHAGNVKRWRDGKMALRWCAAGMVEAGKQFCRVNGRLHLPGLRAALEREFAEPVGPRRAQRRGGGSLMLTARHRSSRKRGNPPDSAMSILTAPSPTTASV